MHSGLRRALALLCPSSIGARSQLAKRQNLEEAPAAGPDAAFKQDFGTSRWRLMVGCYTKDTPNNSCYDFAVSRGLIV
jgi:hypothetical protein